MPIYNGGSYLKHTIDCVRGSRYEEWELLCIDDGSTDDSPVICKTCIDEDNRIKYIRKENGGVASARNLGLKEARGKYICFCDQDDIVDPLLYKTMIEDATKYNSDIVITNVKILKNGTESVAQGGIRKPELIKDGEDKTNLLKWLLMHDAMDKIPDNKINNTVWNVMFSSSLITDNKIEFVRTNGTEDDWRFLIESVGFANIIFLEPKALYTWRIHDNQTTQTPKYVENYLRKSCILRQQFIDKEFEKLNLSTNELNKYNTRYYGRIICHVVSNEALWIASDNSVGKFKTSVQEIREANKELKKYVCGVSKQRIFKSAKKSYGVKNAVVVLLVNLRLYGVALKFRLELNKKCSGKIS